MWLKVLKGWLAGGVALCAVVLAGCTVPPPGAQDRADADKPLVCEGPEQCAAYWQRAQTWLVHNSVWKIETVTDDRMATFTPTRRSDERGYEVRRQPAGSNRQELTLATTCRGYMWRCNVSDTAARAYFYRYVSGAE